MDNSFFKVLRSGINSTYQDKGRFGLQHFGIAAGGCMDGESFSLANAILGNKETEGMIEFAYQGPLLKLKNEKINFAITGDVIFNIIRNNSNIEEGNCYQNYILNDGEQIDIISTRNSVYG